MNKNGDDSSNLRRALTALQTHSFGSSGYFVESVHAIIMQMILMSGNWELKLGTKFNEVISQ